MSESHQSRAERIAKYKEERRKQLASQYGTSSEPSRRLRNGHSSSSEGPLPRSTRASNLRAASAAHDNASSQSQGPKKDNNEKTSAQSTEGSEQKRVPTRRLERDKSSKRKSNLNRSLNSEEIPPQDSDDIKNRRRRRRFFPPEVLEPSTNGSTTVNDVKTVSDSDLTASVQSQVSPNTASSVVTSSKSNFKKSELSYHMENARRGVTASYSEMGRPRSSLKQRSSVLSSPRSKSDKSDSSEHDTTHAHSHREINGYGSLANKENYKRRTDLDKDKKVRLSSENDDLKGHKNLTKKMEELTALTKETLARVERLTSKNRESPRREIKRPSISPIKKVDTPRAQFKSRAALKEKSPPPSILKKKSLEEAPPDPPAPVPVPAPNHLPVSILKRKVSQDEHHKTESTTHTPPVTFSPSVVEPATTNRKQGILKKRRSLDESQVMRHRSCSPDVASKSDSKSILKTQRRSSLEELTRIKSPEVQLQSILKRKPSKYEEEADQSLNSPQSILKKRSGASSAGSTGGSPHVSITTAVILAAARGAEMVLDQEPEPVRPILKKKSSEEHSHNDSSHSDVPKPILKKKHSTDTDDYDDKPKPILKSSRPIDRDTDSGDKYFHKSSSSETECEVRPILKQGTLREEVPRPRLSFCEESTDGTETSVRRPRRAIGISDLASNSSEKAKEEDRSRSKPRPLSVSELVSTFEKTVSSTGAIPKRTSMRKNFDRCRTQPVTSNELEASLQYVIGPTLESYTRRLLPNSLHSDDHGGNHSLQSLLDFTSSLEHDNQLNTFLSSSFRNTSPDTSSCAKMSSDSAFQSLGDGLELEQDEVKSPKMPSSPNHGYTKPDLQMKSIAEEAKKSSMSSDSAFQSLGDGLELEQDEVKSPKMPSSPNHGYAKPELQMKSIAEEAKKCRLARGNDGVERYRNRKFGVIEKAGSSRFSTQPVTFDEVQEASRINKSQVDTEEHEENEPSRLSLSERIKIFNVKMIQDEPPKRDVPRRRMTRFQTHPVTADEFESARSLSPSPYAALDDNSTCPERKSILKSSVPRVRETSLDASKTTASSTKRDSSLKTSVSGRTPSVNVETSDATCDEGISCNDSGSDSENATNSLLTPQNKLSRAIGRSSSLRLSSSVNRSSSDKSSDDSSGGREVRSIFKGRLNFRQELENVLCRSKSHSTVHGNEKADLLDESQRPQTQGGMPRTIAELQATLQRKGDSEWKKRLSPKSNIDDELKFLKEKNKYNDELSEKSILASKKDELDAASQNWKSRVEKSDASKFSVAGRMEKSKDVSSLPINIPSTDIQKPQAKRFKGKEGDSSSTPVSPEKVNHLDLKRSQSVPDSEKNDSSESESSLKGVGKIISVLKPDDYTYQSFFRSSMVKRTSSEKIDISSDDLDAIPRHKLLVQKKNVLGPQRRHVFSKNPLKVLASRTDILTEYVEEKVTGIAERETRRLNVEKLAKTSDLAIEALAGLASKEDFTAVPLKKPTNPTYLVPYKDLMLLQVKGRRHVQTRLVEPTVDSINEGDNFILITPKYLYHYVGSYSNVIEQSRAADVVNHIQQTGDLGCKGTKVTTINSKQSPSVSRDVRNFWKLLGGSDTNKVTKAGNPNEDEVYEANILSTNMIYTIENNELVPVEEYWGKIPKIEMLKTDKVYVFDFGSEMYVWSGKNASGAEKQRALKLAKEMWDIGYNYSECNVCPLNVASILGERHEDKPAMKGNVRPDWALFAKLTQHRETIMFKEKFLDWPDLSRLIRTKSDDSNKGLVDPSYDIKPCDVKKMLKKCEEEPDFVIEGHHLGRGDKYYDENSHRLFEFDTLELTVWQILENTSEKLKDKSIGHFYDEDSYILRWRYRMTVKGRELSGKPSKYAQSGRDRSAYFCWQGFNASINEKGSAALLTVELDNENAPQVRISQGCEPAAFLRLFEGTMVVHSGKRDSSKSATDARMFIVRGELESETSLVEVRCHIRQLRSRTCMVLFSNRKIIIWQGAKSTKQIKKVTRSLVDKLIEKKPSELGLDCNECVNVEEVVEGEENKDFLAILGSNKDSYLSLLNSNLSFDHTIKLFHMSSVSGTFKSTEILCPHRSEHSSPYPFWQNELYSASQPALFLIDNLYELWLWQGWWPEREEEEVELSDQTGSGAVRWQAERRAAMQTAINYWKETHSDDEPVVAYLVWAGLEPLEFQNMFPTWNEREDIAELNIKEGKKPSEKRILETELVLLSRTVFPLSELLQRPLPEGVDPTHLEVYLSPEDFQNLLQMTKEEFNKLPSWKQTALKKEKGLF